MAGSHLLLSEITHTTPRLIRIWFPHFIGWPHKQTHMVLLTARGHHVQEGCKAPANILSPSPSPGSRHPRLMISSSLHPHGFVPSQCKQLGAAASPLPSFWREIFMNEPLTAVQTFQKACHVTAFLKVTWAVEPQAGQDLFSKNHTCSFGGQSCTCMINAPVVRKPGRRKHW